MRICKKINNLTYAVAILAIAMIATLSGCTTTAEYTLGEELAPGHQQMDIRYRIYKGGMLKESGQKDNACKIFQTRLFRTDSINSTSLGQILIGYEANERFGSRKFSYAGQYMFQSAVNDTTGFGFHPVFDSVMLIFSVDTIVGDTTKPIKYNIFELTDALTSKSQEDTLFFANYDPRLEGHLQQDAEPVFTFTFPDPDNGIYTNASKLRLKQTAKSQEFINRLMCKTKVDANGMATDNIEAYSSDSAFVKNFHGLYIEVAQEVEGGGSAVALSAGNTGFHLYGRTRNSGADADILLDTISMKYLFNSTSREAGFVGAQRVENDYSNAEFASLSFDEEQEREEVALGYVDGCGGVYTELQFTDEFLYSLRNLNNSEKDYVSAAINQAILKIYLDGSDYDYTHIDPLPMSELLNSSLKRLGIYTDYKTLEPIPDYIYSKESSGVLSYNGYVNRSLACYEMNISSYMQALANEIMNMEQTETGELDFSKLEIPRTLYLAPGAYDTFSLNRSVIQGSDSGQNPAAIQLELTYTLVK